MIWSLLVVLKYIFLKDGGYIKWEITSVKKYSKDLKQGGLEIPARLTISNVNKTMTDVIKQKLNLLVVEYREINSKSK